jgi:hypothetical protein
MITRLTTAKAQRLFSRLTGKGARLVPLWEDSQDETWTTVSGAEHFQIIREPANPTRAIARTREKDYQIILENNC